MFTEALEQKAGLLPTYVPTAKLMISKTMFHALVCVICAIINAATPDMTDAAVSITGMTASRSVWLENLLGVPTFLRFT